MRMVVKSVSFMFVIFRNGLPKTFLPLMKTLLLMYFRPHQSARSKEEQSAPTTMAAAQVRALALRDTEGPATNLPLERVYVCVCAHWLKICKLDAVCLLFAICHAEP